MPLPPLPDDATINSAGHLSDSVKQENYLRALAEQYKVDIGDLPDPDPGHAGHIIWHNTLVTAAKKVAAAIGAKIVLPPDVIKDGDVSHVTHHNLVTKALADMSAAVPFSVEGGKVLDAYGYRTHTFSTAGSKDKITVTGSGEVQIIVLGGGGGPGNNGAGYPQSVGGTGGGGGIAEMSESQSNNPPTVTLTAGEYATYIGKGGAKAPYDTQPGGNGENTTFIGSDVSLSGTGGGGGGSGNAPGSNGGTGGGGGGMFENESSKRSTPAGKGNPGGDGVAGVGVNPDGRGGGALGSAVGQYGGPGLKCDNGNWWDSPVEALIGGSNGQLGAGGRAESARGNSPGMGGFASTPGGAGIVIIGYKLAKEWI